MTWIVDGSGTRWVDVPRPKRRKSPRALRFADIEVGRQLVQRPGKNWYHHIPVYFIVTDIWFDPVEGQKDPVAGKMIGIARIAPDGEVHPRKSKYPVRGLASQGFHYLPIDYINQCKAKALATNVVGIERGKVIRARPSASLHKV